MNTVLDILRVVACDEIIAIVTGAFVSAGAVQYASWIKSGATAYFKRLDERHTARTLERANELEAAVRRVLEKS